MASPTSNCVVNNVPTPTTAVAAAVTDNVPVKAVETEPLVCNLAVGLLVPIPTLPKSSIRTLSALLL